MAWSNYKGRKPQKHKGRVIPESHDDPLSIPLEDNQPNKKRPAPPVYRPQQPPPDDHVVDDGRGPTHGGGGPPPVENIAPPQPASSPVDDTPAFIPEVTVEPGYENLSFLVKRRGRFAAQALAELVRRQREALKLYAPMPEQNRFHTSMASTRLILGGNRGGKTVAAAAEVARAVTGQDPFGKWPTRDGTFIVVGKDGSHIGKTMYPRLFQRRKSSFLTLPDAETGLWRAYRPWEEADVARKAEARAAEPLIPPRLVSVKGTSWYSKKDNIPRVVRLTTGWELYFFSSESDPPGGFPADGAWFDEEILRADEWLQEIQARLVDRSGRLIWSATPQAATIELYDLHQQAMEEFGLPKPNVQEYYSHLDANRYLPEDAKDTFKARMRRRGEEAYSVRIEGRFAIEGYRVFPEYGDHLRVPRFKIPADWCNYMIVDPGRQVCAVLFASVPPPSARGREGEPLGQYVYFTDELYLRDCDARKFARAVADKLRESGDERVIEGFIIDDQEGRKRETGSGRSIRQQYSRELRRRKVRSAMTGSGFLSAPARPEANREALRVWMTADDDGITKLRVFNDLENFDREMKNFHFRRIAGLVTEQPLKKNDHLCDSAGYAAGMELIYRRPKERGSKRAHGIAAALKRRQRARRKRGQTGGRDFVNIGQGE